MIEALSPEKALSQKGFFVKTISGTSMLPMLVQRVDTVVIKPITASIKKYDVVLFRHNNQLVLHRVVKVCGERFTTRGDNSIEAEEITREQIIGVMTEFCHKGKQQSVTSGGYRLYSRLWVNLYFARSFFKRLKVHFKRKLK